MVISSRAITRSADPKDLSRLANLVHFEVFVHRHLDYRPPLDWIGYTPFLVLEQASRIEAASGLPTRSSSDCLDSPVRSRHPNSGRHCLGCIVGGILHSISHRSQNPLCRGDPALCLVRGVAEKEPFSKDPFHRHAQLGWPGLARTSLQHRHFSPSDDIG